MKLNSSLAAVITGGASGLGEATARRLASHGVKVALFDMNEEKGEVLARELGGVFCKVDVTSDADVSAGFEKARAAQGQERILVCCAGVGNAFKTASRDKKTGVPRTFHTTDFERVVQINLIGTFRCVGISATGMLMLDPQDDGERGVIVNTSLPIARDLMSEGIRINTIMPGLFDTPLMQSVPDHVRAALAASVPFPARLGAPDEFAALAEAMITNSYFNGESVRLDGAIRLAPR
jgi:NAD(P)-dependent dehydrogenase (short-subunit alcohol dehydrogenase family)